MDRLDRFLDFVVGVALWIVGVVSIALAILGLAAFFRYLVVS